MVPTLPGEEPAARGEVVDDVEGDPVALGDGGDGFAREDHGAELVFTASVEILRLSAVGKGATVFAEVAGERGAGYAEEAGNLVV